MQKLFSVHCRNNKYPPVKLTRPLKRDHFKGKVGFHPSHFSGGFVKIRGSNEHFVCVHTREYEEHVLTSKVSNWNIKCPPTPCKGTVSRMIVFNTFYSRKRQWQSDSFLKRQSHQSMTKHPPKEHPKITWHSSDISSNKTLIKPKCVRLKTSPMLW